MKPKLIERWHRLVASRDPSGLDELLAEEVTFESPIVFKPQVGKALARQYLLAALHVLDNEHFRYVNEWYADRSAALEFETVIDGIKVEGVDLIHWNGADRIVRFKVMIRPLKAINLLHQVMARQLQASLPAH